MNIALLTAAGSGTRMHLDIPKQFYHVNNMPLIIHTLKRFQDHPSIDAIIVVTLESWSEVVKDYAEQFGIDKLRWVVPGGETGQESIRLGLEELSKHCSDDDVVMVHDGNRCLVSQEIISNSLAVYKKYGDAVAVVPCVEVVFRSTDSQTSDSSIPREELYRTQTPHTYSLGKLLWAHDEAQKRSIKNTAASCALMYELGETTHFSKGSEKNLKITTMEDLQIFAALLRMEQSEKT